MIKLGLRDPSSGGINEPLRPNEPLRSRTTSILGGSSTGALISGTEGFLASFNFYNFRKINIFVFHFLLYFLKTLEADKEEKHLFLKQKISIKASIFYQIEWKKIIMIIKN